MARNTVIVSVLADTKNFAKGMKDANGVLGTVGKIGKAAVKTVAGVGTAIVGLAVAGGFKRALQLDEAKTQLDALGYSAKQVDGIMGSALTSVKGTAFGLGDAATIAANALAAGVPEGERLTKALTTVANTAALAKVDMGEMGSIFQKVWANGKVTTQEMNQLADRGVPIWQYLSESFGVSNDELRKMISNGEVSADMFEGALGPAVEGMATKMSGSFKGMAANALAALGRVGELFATPILEAGKGLLGVATDLADTLGEKLAPYAEKFGDALGAIDWQATVDRGLELASAAWELISTFSPLLLLLEQLEPVFPQLSEAASTLGDALSRALEAALPSIVTLLGALVTIVAALLPVIADLVTWIAEAAAAILDWVVANADWLSAIGVAAGVIAGIIGAITLWRAVTLAVTAATYGAQGAMLVAGASAKIYNGIMLVVTNAQKVAAVATRVFNAALAANPIGIIITLIASLVAGLIWFFTQTEIGQKIWEEFTRFLGEAWANVCQWIEDVFNGIVEFFEVGLKEWLASIGAWAIGVWNNITTAWNKVLDFFRSIPGKIKAFFVAAGQWLINAGRTIIEGLRSGIDRIWKNVTNWFKSIPKLIGNFFKNAGQWLINAGKWILDGFLNGLKNAWKNVTDFIGGIGDWIAKNKGPKSYDLNLLVNAGKWIMTGLRDGLESQLPALGRTLDGVAQKIAGTEMSASVGYDLKTMAGGTVTDAAGTGGVTYNITVQALAPTPEIGRRVVEAIRDYEATGGRL